jgi:hypothetical protein
MYLAKRSQKGSKTIMIAFGVMGACILINSLIFRMGYVRSF